MDIHSLIPTYLPCQEDRFRASFVCRHWRRTFLKRAELWTHLILSKGKVYTKTLLERSQGSPLNVYIEGAVPASTMMLLASHTKRVSNLVFTHNGLADIHSFLQLNPGPLSLLHTLSLNTFAEDRPIDFNNTHPSLALFSTAVNLNVFHFLSNSVRFPSLSHFVLPNLVEFQLLVIPREEVLVCPLLDFLEASPMLRMVWVRIIATISFEGVPRERVVTLPAAEDITLIMTDGGPGYRIATHLSCPSAKRTSLTHKKRTHDAIPEENIPTFAPLSAIVHRYTKHPVEEIALEINIGQTIACELTFRSSDATVIQLCFKVTEGDRNAFEFLLPSTEIYDVVLAQATRTVQNHPQLSSLKRLRICHGFPVPLSTQLSYIANEAGQLFKSIGPLDELTIYGCDLRLYLNCLPNSPEGHTAETVMLPPIKELTISHPVDLSDDECTAILRLAKSRHTSGIPFERVTLHGEGTPQGMNRWLEPWVTTRRSELL